MWLHVFHSWMSTAFSGLTCVLGVHSAKMITADSVAVLGNVEKFVFTKYQIRPPASRVLHGSCCIFLICNVDLAYPGCLRLMDCVLLRLPWCWCCCPHGSEVWEGKSCCFRHAFADGGDKVLGL